MAKGRVYSHDEVAPEKWKHFSFYFYLLGHSSFMIVYILLRNFKV